MGLLLSHWHCILPVAGVVIAMFFMREKPQKEKNDREATVIPQDTNKE